MNSNFKIIFITGLYIIISFFTSPVFSENIAGSSANLNYISLNTTENSSGAFISDFKFDKENLKYSKYKRAIETVLIKYNSPMVADVDSFLFACRTYNLDCFLLPSIAGVESGFGNAVASGTCNPFGWDQGYMKFNSWDESINTVAKGLKENYINRGAKSVEEIGYIYAAKSDTWVGKVRSFMNQFKVELDKIELYFSS